MPCISYSPAMHDVFQRDLFRLKLETARSYCKAICSSLAPVITAQNTSLKISAHVSSPTTHKDPLYSKNTHREITNPYFTHICVCLMTVLCSDLRCKDLVLCSG